MNALITTVTAEYKTIMPSDHKKAKPMPLAKLSSVALRQSDAASIYPKIQAAVALTAANIFSRAVADMIVIDCFSVPLCSSSSAPAATQPRAVASPLSRR